MYWSQRACQLTFSALFVVLFSVRFALSQSYDICVFDVKTGSVTRVTHIPDAGEYNPSWSNNGKQIAHDVVGGPAPFSQSIYIPDVRTGVSTLLVGAEGGNNPSWSHNGKRIAFDRATVGDANLYVVPASGGTPRLVWTNATDPDWSPNSKRLVFNQPSDGSIRTVAANGELGGDDDGVMYKDRDDKIDETFVAYAISPVDPPPLDRSNSYFGNREKGLAPRIPSMSATCRMDVLSSVYPVLGTPLTSRFDLDRDFNTLDQLDPQTRVFNMFRWRH